MWGQGVKMTILEFSMNRHEHEPGRIFQWIGTKICIFLDEYMLNRNKGTEIHFSKILPQKNFGQTFVRIFFSGKNFRKINFCSLISV